MHIFLAYFSEWHASPLRCFAMCGFMLAPRMRVSFYLDAVSGIDVPVNSAASDVRPRARPRAVSLQSPQ